MILGHFLYKYTIHSFLSIRNIKVYLLNNSIYQIFKKVKDKIYHTLYIL